MPWTTIAASDVINELTPVEVTALQSIQGGSTNLGLILTKVVKQVRSQINAGGNQLDQTGLTIPDSLVEDVISMTRWKWILSFPALKFLATPDRKAANEAAETRLRNIASQQPERERIEFPAVTDATAVPLIQPSIQTVQTAQGQPLNGPKIRRFTRHDQSGII